jgi:hypothetical protein
MSFEVPFFIRTLRDDYIVSDRHLQIGIHLCVTCLGEEDGVAQHSHQFVVSIDSHPFDDGMETA